MAPNASLATRDSAILLRLTTELAPVQCGVRRQMRSRDRFTSSPPLPPVSTDVIALPAIASSHYSRRFRPARL